MHELLLHAPEGLVETLSQALVDELGAMSVSVEDADAGSPAEQALFGEPDLPAPRNQWPHSRLSALFADEAQADAAIAVLMAQSWAGDIQAVALRPVPDQDWVRLTQAQFAPVEITPSFWIVPSWHEPPAAAQRLIRLDPGLAFGTGTHATTRMCLRWIAKQQTEVEGRRVLDYGCGSGILAIAAALHGASEIDAVDIDPAAVQATQANAQANAATLRTGAPEIAQGRYDLVLANILASPLKLLAPLLCAHVALGGYLVLAGVLARQVEELRTAYAPWLAIEVGDEEEGWVLMTGRRGS